MMMLGVTKVVSLPDRWRAPWYGLNSETLSVGTVMPIGMGRSHGEISCQIAVPGAGSNESAVLGSPSILGALRCDEFGWGVPFVIPNPLNLMEERPTLNQLFLDAPLPYATCSGKT